MIVNWSHALGDRQVGTTCSFFQTGFSVTNRRLYNKMRSWQIKANHCSLISFHHGKCWVHLQGDHFGGSCMTAAPVDLAPLTDWLTDSQEVTVAGRMCWTNGGFPQGSRCFFFLDCSYIPKAMILMILVLKRKWCWPTCYIQNDEAEYFFRCLSPVNKKLHLIWIISLCF